MGRNREIDLVENAPVLLIAILVGLFLAFWLIPWDAMWQEVDEIKDKLR